MSLLIPFNVALKHTVVHEQLNLQLRCLTPSAGLFRLGNRTSMFSNSDWYNTVSTNGVNPTIEHQLPLHLQDFSLLHFRTKKPSTWPKVPKQLSRKRPGPSRAPFAKSRMLPVSGKSRGKMFACPIKFPELQDDISELVKGNPCYFLFLF